jgi:hypothetical protein
MNKETVEFDLIPYPNQEGEWLIISDKVEPNWEGYAISEDEIVYVDFRTLGFAKGDNVIIASTIFINKSIPLLRKEELKFTNEYKILFDKAIRYLTGSELPPDLRQSFINGSEWGYNKHAETHVFTLEDIEKAIWYGYNQPVPNLTNGNLNDKDYILKNSKEFIKSLQQQNKYKVTLKHKVDCTLEICNGECGLCEHLEQILTIDKEGYVKILSIS